jgi:acetyl-CoA acyltransferase
MSITVAWNTAQVAGISREDMDAWSLRSHQRAVSAIDDGKFVDEIVTIEVATPDGALVEFSVDEHPRRRTTLARLASLPVLHPEIAGFSITAGNSSGINDAAAALTLVEDGYAESIKQAFASVPIAASGARMPTTLLTSYTAGAVVSAWRRCAPATARAAP